MLRTSNGYQLAIAQPSRLLKAKITINDVIYDDLDIINIQLDEELFLSDSFTIGTASMSSVEIMVKYSQRALESFFESEEMKVEVGVEVSDGVFEFISLGYFIIEDVEKNDFDITIYANDRMIKTEKDYYSHLTYPTTLGAIADEICKNTGLTLSTPSFLNSNYTLAEKPDLSNQTMRTVLSYVVELAGGYARINRNGELEIFNLVISAQNTYNYASKDRFANENKLDDELVGRVEGALNHNLSRTISTNRFISLTNKVFTISKIDELVIDCNGIQSSRGSGENIYYISDNPLCFDPEKVIDNIYTAIKDISYIPFEMKWQGDASIQCGDSITIRNKGAIINTLLTARTLTYAGGLTEVYKASGVSKTEKSTTNSGAITTAVSSQKQENSAFYNELNSKVDNSIFENYKQTVDKRFDSTVNKSYVDTQLVTKVDNSAFENYKKTLDGVNSETFSDLKTTVAKKVTTGDEFKQELIENNKKFDFTIGSEETRVKLSSDEVLYGFTNDLNQEKLTLYSCFDVNNHKARYAFINVATVNKEAVLNLPSVFKGYPYSVISVVKNSFGDYMIKNKTDDSFTIEVSVDMELNVEIIIDLKKEVN